MLKSKIKLNNQYIVWKGYLYFEFLQDLILFKT